MAAASESLSAGACSGQDRYDRKRVVLHRHVQRACKTQQARQEKVISAPEPGRSCLAHCIISIPCATEQTTVWFRWHQMPTAITKLLGLYRKKVRRSEPCRHRAFNLLHVTVGRSKLVHTIQRVVAQYATIAYSMQLMGSIKAMQ